MTTQINKTLGIAGVLLLTVGCQDGASGPDGAGDVESSGAATEGAATGGAATAAEGGDAPGGDDGWPGEGADPVEPPAEGNEGVFACPTITPPAYTISTVESLSDPFRRSCASCHGAAGAGRDKYPAINGTLSLADYRAVIRQGRNEMPAFDESFISDAQIEADYAELIALTEAGVDPGPASGEWGWTEQEVQEAYARGLEVWRQPDHEGVACANCHTPDAIDLAVLGYPDDAILRRAALHVPPEDAGALVDLVHAQRRRFDIIRPCRPDYRPLQPGGEVLPGDTPAEQDAAFGEQLRDLGILIETSVVRDLDDAREAFAQLQGVDLRHLRIGIPLPRWTEDGFNGDVHNDVNDYMPPLGSVPYDPDSWYALVDEYVEDPTDERFYALLERLDEESNTDAFEAEFDQEAPNCKYQTAAGYLVTLNRDKRRSQLVVQHMFRRSLEANEEWDALGGVPLRGYAEHAGEPLNPFFHLGGDHIEPICYPSTEPGKVANARIIESFPEDFRDEVPAEDLETGELRKLPKQLVHPWMTLGQIYDPALLMREDAANNKLHYWHFLSFVHDGYHDPFFTLHRLATQAHYYTELRGTDEHPGEVSHYGRFPTHPLLDAGRQFLSEFSRNILRGDDPRAVATHRIKLNVMRTALLLQRELLGEGQAVREPGKMPFDYFRQYIDRLDRELGEDHGPLIVDALDGEVELYTTELRALIDEVEALVAAAPVVD